MPVDQLVFKFVLVTAQASVTGAVARRRALRQNLQRPREQFRAHRACLARKARPARERVVEIDLRFDAEFAIVR